jgi:nucleotide-binding universal stress UspA family protein
LREIKKIIWATDGSRESEEALNYAVFVAKKFGSKIIGISVIPMSDQLINDYFRKSKGEVHTWAVKVDKKLESKLSSISVELASQGVKFKGAVLEGEPNKEIIGLAQREKADLIVMGKRGHGLIDKILIGNNTLKVLRGSPIPVLAVRKRDKESPVDIRNILVPLDITEKADSALNYAIGLAERINARISVLYVFRLDTYAALEIPPHVLANLVEELLAFSSTELTKRVKEAKLIYATKNKEINRLEIKAEVIRGISPLMTIVDYATSKNTDLIVINSHGRKGVKKFFLGSVAEKVIQESPCAVLALKP